MSKLSQYMCRLFGHDWGWPDIPMAVAAGALHMGMLWRGCRRCGVRQADENDESCVIIGPAFQGDPRECAFNARETHEKLQALGDRVRREMGWKEDGETHD